MEAISTVDDVFEQQVLLRREKALAATVHGRLPTSVALQIPIWCAFLPAPKPNPLPHVAAAMAFSI